MPTKTEKKTLPRERALSAIERLNKNASYDDIMYKMYVLQKIEKGEQDIREGKVYTEKEAPQTPGKVAEVI
jgi:hypothetical protein